MADATLWRIGGYGIGCAWWGSGRGAGERGEVEELAVLSGLSVRRLVGRMDEVAFHCVRSGARISTTRKHVVSAHGLGGTKVDLTRSNHAVGKDLFLHHCPGG